MDVLKKEDYAEPACPLCIENLKKGTNITSIPIDRVIEKLDNYFSKNDFEGAKRHLLYWKAEAEAGFDLRGKFSVLNELLGVYRKESKKDEALNTVTETLETIEKLQNGDSISAATAYLNIATVYGAFSLPDKSLLFFEKAAKIYETELDTNDSRLGGLYNNFALTLVDLHRFDEALKLYDKAIKIMEQCVNGELEIAITYLNIANAYEIKSGLTDGEKEINNCLDIAEKLLLTDGIPKNGYYAFVCEKCAPTFSYYGRFFFANELKKKAADIYEGS